MIEMIDNWNTQRHIHTPKHIPTITHTQKKLDDTYEKITILCPVISRSMSLKLKTLNNSKLSVLKQKILWNYLIYSIMLQETMSILFHYFPGMNIFSILFLLLIIAKIKLASQISYQKSELTGKLKNTKMLLSLLVLFCLQH